MYITKFQKRGLPHMHLLVILKNGYKINTPNQYDTYVQGEIPDSHTNPALHNVVLKHMLYGPCEENNKICPCMMNEKCKLHYPRKFSEKTNARKGCISNI